MNTHNQLTMTTTQVRFVPEHYCDLMQKLLHDFYAECHPMPGSSSCFNKEDRDEIYVDATNFLDKYILEIGDAVGMSDDDEDSPTDEQRMAAFDLICQFAGSPAFQKRLKSGQITLKNMV